MVDTEYITTRLKILVENNRFIKNTELREYNEVVLNEIAKAVTKNG